MLTITPINFAQKTNTKSVTNHQQNQSKMHSQPMQYEVSFKSYSPVKYSKDNPLFEDTFKLFEKVRKEVFEPGMELLGDPRFERGTGAIVPYKKSNSDLYSIKVGDSFIDISLIRHKDDPSSYTLLAEDLLIGENRRYTFNKDGLLAIRELRPLSDALNPANMEKHDVALNRRISGHLQSILDAAKEEEEKGLAAIHRERNLNLINGI